MGRVLTILYAIIGIPLTFLYLSNMGNFLADCFRLFYKKICCDICCCRQCDKKKIRQRLRNRRRQRYGPVPDDVTVTLDSPTTTECGNYAKTFDQEIMWSKQCEDDVTSPRSVLSVPSSLCLVDEGGDASCTNVHSHSDANGCYTEKSRQNDVSDGAVESEVSKSKTDLERLQRKSTGFMKTINIDRMDESVEDGKCAKETDIIVDEEEDQLYLQETSIVGSDDPSYETSKTGGDYITFNSKFTLPEDKANLLLQFLHSKESDICLFEDFSADRKVSTDLMTRDNSSSAIGRIEAVDSVTSNPKLVQKLSESVKMAIVENKEKLKRIERRSKQNNRVTSETLDKQSYRNANIPFTGSNMSHLAPEKKFLRCRSVESTKKKRRTRRAPSEPTVIRDRLAKANAPSPPPPPLKGIRAKHQSKCTADVTCKSRNSKWSGSSEVEMALLSPPRLSYRYFSRSPDSSGAVSKSAEASSTPEQSSVSIGKTSLDDITYDSAISTEPWPSDVETYTSETEARLNETSLKRLVVGNDLPFAYIDDTFDNDDALSESGDKVTVPVYVCLIIIAGYTLSGSCLFAGWENWDLLTGSYFCFVTLSTIGLGDIVPGSDMTEWEKLVLCALWLVVGLSLLAMCFNLMQEEVKEKCRYIGKKLGLLKDEGGRV